MLAIVSTLTPGCQNKFIDCQNAKICIAVLLIVNANILWNSTAEWLDQAYPLRDSTREWLNHPIYCEYRPLFTTQDEWTIVKYVMNILRSIWCWTLWMSNRHTVTMHHASTVYNHGFDHMDEIMWALAKKKSQWKEYLYFTVEFVRQKLSKYHSKVTPTTFLHLTSAHIMDPFRKLRSFR
jgi:hypothetical protein